MRPSAAQASVPALGGADGTARRRPARRQPGGSRAARGRGPLVPTRSRGESRRCARAEEDGSTARRAPRAARRSTPYRRGSRPGGAGRKGPASSDRTASMRVDRTAATGAAWPSPPGRHPSGAPPGGAPPRLRRAPPAGRSPPPRREGAPQSDREQEDSEQESEPGDEPEKTMIAWPTFLQSTCLRTRPAPGPTRGMDGSDSRVGSQEAHPV